MKKSLSITARKRSTQPCIRNHRIPASDILSYFALGMAQEELLDDFPELTQADILATLAYAANQINRKGQVTSAG